MLSNDIQSAGLLPIKFAEYPHNRTQEFTSIGPL